MRILRWRAPFGGVTAVAALAALALVGCDRAPSPDGLKEWSASDHDGERKPTGAGAARQGPKSNAPGSGVAQMVDLTWRSQCQSCHGPAGRGDGPQGPMNKAADLGREDWQSKVKDEEIAATILNGKGKMPKFDLPDEIVKGLVARVRSFRGR
jgi:cytochrome c oxidase cbb3-type subunit 3